MGRLVGRLLRCRAGVGPPNVGLRAMEKSTLVLHCIEIRGRQLSAKLIVASNAMSKMLTITVVEGLGSGPYSGVNLYTKVTSSLGRQVRGGMRPGTSDNVSIVPSERFNSAFSNITSQFMNGVTSKSRLATVVGRPEYEFDRE